MIFVFYFKENVWLIVFVDDILLTGEKKEVEETVQYLKEKLKAKDMGEIKNFLGMEILKTEDTLRISQQKYIKKILEEFNMSDAKGVATPMVEGFQVCVNEEQKIDAPFRKLIGSLMYLACTSRPDILYAVSFLSRYLDQSTSTLWTAGKRILRYLNATLNKSLEYRKGSNKLEGFSDADWAGDKVDRKSTSGSVIMYAGNPISWFSKKQSCVALSTAEAEYVAAAAASQELLNLKGVLEKFCDIKNVVLHMDNKSAISMANSYENSKRGKHIEIKEHFIKDIVSKKIISIDYVATEENIADIFTKALTKDKFEYFRSSLRIE